MAYQKIFLILGDQLFPQHDDALKDDQTLIFMAEDYGLCTHFKYHKQKILLFLAAMRHHRDDLIDQHDYNRVIYWHLQDTTLSLSYWDKLQQSIDQYADIQEIISYEPSDHFFAQELKAFCEKQNLKLTYRSTHSFLFDQDDFEDYCAQAKKPFMHSYYQRQRKALNILMTDQNKPVGGQWSYDADNRKKLPQKITIPDMPNFTETDHVKDVKALIVDIFAEHPGSVEHFNYAVTRQQATHALNRFLKERFELFGPYEDAIDSAQVHIFHSVLSPYLNCGLLTPREVLDAALFYAEKHDVHLPSVEGFVRQIMGWREFIKGMYDVYEDELRGNHFRHTRRMRPCWYNGTTGLPPVDDAIHKAQKHAYTHHIERLMVLGNVMLMCELDPDEVYQWFMEMYIDSADWVMVPNVFGMTQFADGGLFATKPYIAGSNYIDKMSNYSKKEPWGDVMNGLYWRFVEKHRPLFEQNPRMAMMTRSLDKMNKDKRARIFDLANEFIGKVTHGA